MAAAEPSLFPPTRWTLIERVRSGNEREVEGALELLCRAYWQPLYCVARGRGFSEADAKDAVQGFFECLLRRETFGTAEESAGRLRSFLLGAFGHYCVQQWRKAATQKRGGLKEHVSLDDVAQPWDLEQKFLKSAGQNLTPEVLYQREWATAVLERSLAALKEDYAARGWTERFDALSGPLLQNSDTSLDALAERLGITAGVLRMNLHRMRGHYRTKVEQELAATLDSDDPELIRQELRELFEAFA